MNTLWTFGDSFTDFFYPQPLMVDQLPNRKGAIESLKGDESFRNCNLNN